jgi:uncharacterized protein YpmS
MKKIFMVTGLVMFLAMIFACKASAAPQNAQDAITDAQAKSQYLFVMFYEKKDGLYKLMDEKLKNYNKGNKDMPLLYRAKMTDPKEAEIVAKYRVMGAPMPLVLVFAPNGVVTGGFPTQISDEQLKSSFPSQFVLNILKVMQDGKLALVMLQNNSTKFNIESTKAADEFAKTKGLIGAVEKIYADPEDAASKDLMMQSKIPGVLTEATIILIAPPGKIGGVYTGKINQKQLMAGLAACSGGSCKPGAPGCGPKK